MHSKNSTYPSTSRALLCLIMFALATAMTVMPTWAQQTTVPPTARQAATMPAFAHRLIPSATSQAASRQAATVHAGAQRGSPLDYNYYENGPVNGQVDAWTINFGFTATDSIQIDSTITSVQFWAWLIPGDTITSVEVQFGAAPFGNEVFDGTVSLTQSNCFTNGFGYNVCMETGNFTGPSVSGNAWITLGNASVPSGDPVYWDENSGVDCNSQGCPSLAEANSVGTIPSEAFSVVANGPPPPPPCYHSGGNVQIIHDFTAQEGVPYGVTMDKTGNLYGLSTGGDNGLGLAYKLAGQEAWVLDPLYSFTGGYNGFNPLGVIVGPNGSLYGGAAGGLTDCNGSYCGLIFNLTPPPSACRTALCAWKENVLYRFTGDTGSTWFDVNVSAFDAAGNLYGTSLTGGDYGFGTVFKLTPSGGGWTQSILYSFTGTSDGSGPSQVLVGNDGNLYGVADGGVYNEGVVFQLTPSGDHWIESVLRSFQGSPIDGFDPSYLFQDSVGNLYGIANMFDAGPIFMLAKSGEGWVFSEYLVEHPYGNYEFLNNLVIDPAGNLYGTGNGGPGCRGYRCDGITKSSYRYYGFIFKASHGSEGWQYQDLALFGDYDFSSTGALALDSQGNIYGTTRDCGQHGVGTAWQFTP